MMQHSNSPRMHYPQSQTSQMQYSAQSPMSPGSYEKESRKVSSVIVSEEFLEPARPEEVRYVEVEQFEERVVRVPKREVNYVDKRVPKIEFQYVDKIVEVPQVVYVDVPVEVPRYVDVVVQKFVPQWVDRPVEHIVRVPVPVVVKREEIVHVPGPVIEVPKPYIVQQPVEVPRYVAEEVPVIVAQTVKPILTETAEAVDVEVFEYEPEVVAVDIHVAKAVDARLIAAGVVAQHHRVVTVPAGQYNMMMRQLNIHLNEKEMALLPFMQESGQIPFLREEIQFEIARQGLEIEGWRSKGLIYEAGHFGTASHGVVGDSHSWMAGSHGNSGVAVGGHGTQNVAGGVSGSSYYQSSKTYGAPQMVSHQSKTSTVSRSGQGWHPTQEVPRLHM